MAGGDIGANGAVLHDMAKSIWDEFGRCYKLRAEVLHHEPLLKILEEARALQSIFSKSRAVFCIVRDYLGDGSSGTQAYLERSKGCDAQGITRPEARRILLDVSPLFEKVGNADGERFDDRRFLCEGMVFLQEDLQALISEGLGSADQNPCSQRYDEPKTDSSSEDSQLVEQTAEQDVNSRDSSTESDAELKSWAVGGTCCCGRGQESTTNSDGILSIIRCTAMSTRSTAQGLCLCRNSFQL